VPAGVEADAVTVVPLNVIPVSDDPSDQVKELVPPDAEYAEVEAEDPYVRVRVESPVTVMDVGVSVTAVDESPAPALVVARRRMV
jgi:hypothetical protein